jgi:hypothetical protein
MAGVSPTDLHDFAVELLEASVIALNTIPTFAPGLVGAPERSLVTLGEPAADCCPQLTVHIAGIAEAPPDAQPYGYLSYVQLIVTIFRCSPSGTQSKTGYVPPAVTALEATAEQGNADAWALWIHLHARHNQRLLFGRCKKVFWDGLRSLPVSGGCAGWVLGVRASLDGYQEDLS